ncbi:MAG: hypothetical protein LBU83_07900 [Bacteroidales bacterium]|jgi:hypothetical protein|nr:hypothetical protein [Bacteroidales bacterium]
MKISSQLLSEIEQLPGEYEQEVFNFVSFLTWKLKQSGADAQTEKKEVNPIKSVFSTLKGMEIDSNIERIDNIPESMFGAFPGINTDIEREVEDRI